MTRMGVGLVASVTVLLIFVDRFPQPAGVDVGGPDILLLTSILVAVIGGAILGDGVSKLFAYFRHRIVRIILQILGVGMVLTPLLRMEYLSPLDIFLLM